MKGFVEKIKAGFIEKRHSGSTLQILNKLVGKTVCFGGRYQYRQYGPLAQLVSLADAQQAKVTEALDAKTHFLVLPDLNDGKTLQKQAQSLNAKGASIQVLDADTFIKLVEPSEQEVLALLRGGTANAEIFKQVLGRGVIVVHQQRSQAARFSLNGEKFDGLDLSGFKLDQIALADCSFVGCTLNNCVFSVAGGCNFSKASGTKVQFGDVVGASFRQTTFTEASFHGSISAADFSGADLTGSRFNKPSAFGGFGGATVISQASFVGAMSGNRNSPASVAPVFAGAKLCNSRFNHMQLDKPDFDAADLTRSSFSANTLGSASFCKANLTEASFVSSKLHKANLSGALCIRSNFADADLTDAVLDKADLSETNFLGATLQGVDLNKAKNYVPQAASTGTVGPALTELDTLAGHARNIQLTFNIATASNADGDAVRINTIALKHGWGVHVPPSLMVGRVAHNPNRTLSDAMLHIAKLAASHRVRFETVEVKSTKSPKTGKALRDLVMQGISEAFGQPLPPEAELAKAIKLRRDALAEQGTADRERREAAKKLAEKQKKTAKRQIAKKIEKEVGKVTDIATFLKALELRADKSKIDKATKMLKAEKFQLFNDITDAHLNGVVKSQTDADLVYACRIESNGQYACCTQNLNICGGLRGSICKHLLVLIIGLVKAGQLDPSSIDTWIAKSHDTKPELNKETMGEIFIRYKGAEAGEVDWRPTETVPEDYYAV